MNLDNLTIEIRPRRPWEAVDLGVLMARRWWWQLTQVWLVLTLPPFLLLAFLPAQWLWLQAFLLWWFKPVFERPLLMILSQTVFGEYPSSREVLRAFPRLAMQQVLASLTWRRLSPSRSMDTPVIQLEGLSGRRRSERLSILHREGTSPASALTIFGIHMEGFIALALAIFVMALIPSQIEIDWIGLVREQNQYWVMLFFNVLTYIAAALVAPFYVATGFALYLNRRVRLEAWDIEIAFRRMVARRQAENSEKVGGGGIKKTSSIVASLLVVSLMTFPHVGEAGDDVAATPLPSIQNATRESSRQLIQEIKQGEQFNVRETERYIHIEPDEDEIESDMDLSWLKSIGEFFGVLAKAGEIVLWLLALALVILVVLSYRHWLKRYNYSAAKRGKSQAPSMLFGMEVSEASLPDDVGASAREAWLRGDRREALSLLYRACLFQLIRRGIDLRDGDTEGRCLNKSRRFLGRNTKTHHHLQYFENLTKIWQRFAYGHISPADQEVLGLCDNWQTVWEVDTLKADEG